MIDWISNWLKDIILIVLFAAFVDLLLPSTNIQKYAKMILGLLIILTIISPILSLFSNDFAIENLVNGLENETLSKETVAYDYETEVDQEYEEKMIKEVEVNMLNEFKNLVENKHDIFVTDLKLDANIVNENWVINRLTIYISLRNTDEDLTNSEIKDIQRIEDISINIDQEDKEAVIVDENLDIINDLKELIQKEWGFDKEIINVVVIEE